MEATHRYRLLIYFAAVIFCLSVCFANAEEVNQAQTKAVGTEQMSTLFARSPGRVVFMPAFSSSLVVPSFADRDAPVVPASVLRQVTESSRPHHFWHGLSSKYLAPHGAGLVFNDAGNVSTKTGSAGASASSASSSGAPTSSISVTKTSRDNETE